MRKVMALVLALLLAGAVHAAGTKSRADIHWDKWGVPHIFASSEPALFHAFGWSQAHSHGDLLLRLYGQARGRAAEYWGEDHLDSDRWMLANGVPDRAEAWLAQQSPGFRRNLEAFAAGINAYAREHPERIAPDSAKVLPVHAADVLAHMQRVIFFTFVASQERVMEEADDGEQAAAENGSNAWAIAPGRAAGGRAMLLANPHLPWSGLYTFYEAQLDAPGVNLYGAALVGFPVIVIGFNDKLGWTHTVNPLDAYDVYRLAPADGGYRWNGGVQAYEDDMRTVKVLQPDGSLASQALRLRRSLHGPVIKEAGGHAYALRVAGIERGGMAEQWWEMGKARSLAQFDAAMRRLQIPMFNVVYADHAGNILYQYNGFVPKRTGGNWAQWQEAVNGDESSSLWQGLHSLGELPRVLNPPSQWVHNANDPPWTATLPQAANGYAAYPSYFVPPSMSLRAQRSARMVAEDRRISFEEMIGHKHSTRVELADRVLDDLLAAARQGSPQARDAAQVLGAWDRKTDADSRGAVLFAEWAKAMGFMGDEGAALYARPWNEEHPLATPAGLADAGRAVQVLEQAAGRVRAAHGALDVAWGDVARMRVGKYDLPANGGPGGLGIYRVLSLRQGADGKQAAVHGDSFVLAVEFRNKPNARVLLAYGNASQPGTAHAGDQLELMAQKKMRPVSRSLPEVLKHRVSTKVLQLVE